tara:strand:- start:132 stop:653 length:522 start_codon:yes stop_codon:yes gene_type:complete
MNCVFKYCSFFLIFLYSCSEPLDASKVEVKEMLLDVNSDEPLSLIVPAGAVEFPGADLEDMLGMYSVYSKKVRMEDFAIEIEFITLSGINLQEIVQEKLEEIKVDSDAFRLIKRNEDGFLFEKKEINGDLNYGFIKLKVFKNKYASIFPEPKPDGNTSLEEANYMLDILNRNL